MLSAYQLYEYSLVLTADLQLATVRSTYLAIHPLSLEPPHISGRLPRAASINGRMYGVKVGLTETLWSLQKH